MDKYTAAANIGLVLASKGAATYGTLILNGSDPVLVAYFGDVFKGMRVVIDGLNNIIRAYVTNRRGITSEPLALIGGTIAPAHSNASKRDYDAMSLHLQSRESYSMLQASKQK